MINNIPLELRELRQWVCATTSPIDDLDKIPINPKTGLKASPTNKKHWGTYDEAVKAITEKNPHIGFVLTKKDPYAVIDLDDPYNKKKPWSDEKREAFAEVNRKIANAFESYTEISQSGQGLHIVVKGKVPSGLNKDTVEVYSDARYMIFTGNVHKSLEIVEKQELLDILYGEMTSGHAVSGDLIQEDGFLSDDEVFDMASHAENSEKFLKLCNGNWKQDYESQSEADLALLSILCFYSKDNDQVRRLFRYSILGQRDKATKNDTYLDYTLRRIRNNQPPPIDLTNLPKPKKEESVKKEVIISYPPGLVGEIAQYIYASSIRPVSEIALIAAIGLVAGICGRSYNISGTGLNQYLILLATTGAGKEGINIGINSLLSAVREFNPTVDDFMGPSAFASGQALIKVLDQKKCFISVLGEFGLTLQQLSDPRAMSSLIMLRRVLLDLYSKSGWNSLLHSSAYSDVAKNTELVRSPNVTILGESTPETFYEGLDSSHIAEGLIPRFTIVEYNGVRPPRNKNALFSPDANLVKKFSDLVTIALSTNQNNTCCQVKMDIEAERLLDALDVYSDNKINNSQQDVIRQLWNRAHLKALKLSALIAVGVNMHYPKVDANIAKWSIDFIRKDIFNIQKRFTEGSVGTGDSRLNAEVVKAIKHYLFTKIDALKSYNPNRLMHTKSVISYDYLRRKMRTKVVFTRDKRGAVRALKETIADMIHSGLLIEISKEQAFKEFKTRAACYCCGDTWSE